MIIIIAAYSSNMVIGKNGRIPWKIDGDLKRFKKLTTGNVVVMGRKTHEEIGRPLPDRVNVVVSSTGEYEGCINVRSLKEALERFPKRDIFIAGGARLYSEALDIADTMYITEVCAEIEGDTFFPKFDESKFTKTQEEYIGGDMPYRYVTYKRKEVIICHQKQSII